MLGQESGAVHFYNNSILDSVVYFNLTFNWSVPFVPIRKVFNCTYTNNNLDSLPTNISQYGNLHLKSTEYGNMLHFSYSTFNNQKQLIGLDVNEFLYINDFFTSLHNNSLFPYGQQLFFINKNLKTLNTNCKNLVNEIKSNNMRKVISYTFDDTHDNRIKEINVLTTTSTDAYKMTYKFSTNNNHTLSKAISVYITQFH